MTTIGRVSTHVLDSVLGRPAAGIPAVLEHLGPDGTLTDVGHGVTDADGRIGQLNAGSLEPGEYRLTLNTADYFEQYHSAVFYPSIVVRSLLPGDRGHYHIAVLASTYAFTTYLGS